LRAIRAERVRYRKAQHRRCEMEICPNCLGRKEIKGPRAVAPGFRRTKDCPTCEGSGAVSDAKTRWVRCNNCDGWGMVGPLIAEFTCGECNGFGFVPPRNRGGMEMGLEPGSSEG